MIWLLENHRHSYPRFITLSPLRLIPKKKDIYEYTLLPSLKNIFMNIYSSISTHQHKSPPLPTTCVFVQPPCIVTSFVFVFVRAPLWLILYMYLYSYVFARWAPLYILWILFDQRIAAKEVQCSTTHGKILNRIDLFIIINHFLSFSTSLTSEVDFLCHMWNYLYCFPFINNIEFVG